MIEKELHTIKDEGMYELVDLSNAHIDNLLGNKLVLQQKCGLTGLIEHYKAHLTARGTISMNPSIMKRFALVVKSTSLQVFYMLAVILSLQIQHLDVTAAFLSSTLKETLHMRQPKGFEEAGKESWVWRLKKAIYGLKQGGHKWYTCR